MKALTKKFKIIYKTNNVEEINQSFKLIFCQTFSINYPKFDYLKLCTLRLPQFQILRAQKLLKMRAMHWPLQYLLKRWHYAEIELLVQRPVFIPRLESSQIVDICFLALSNNQKLAPDSVRGNFLEIGTGSGAISTLLLKRYEGLTGVGCDINPLAVKLTKKNIQRLLGPFWKEIYKLKICDFENIKTDGMEEFEFIVSNPPYINPEHKKKMHPQILKYEDHRALFSPNAGFSHTERIFKFAESNLKLGGFVCLELDQEQIENTSKFLEKRKSWGEVEFFKDMFGKERFVLVYKIL